MINYISHLPSPAHPFPRRVCLLGSTGSIGVSTLKVIAAHPQRFVVEALAAGRNAELLAAQVQQFQPRHVAVLDEETAERLRALLAQQSNKADAPEIHIGPRGYAQLAALPEADFVLSAQVGAAGLAGTAAAAVAGKIICLANKESLVLAGGLIRSVCAATGAVILPVDSEHHAIFQALTGRAPASAQRLILTASGGPFRGRTREELRSVTVEQALRHPNWSMGAKITIDSATFMNKGLEIIEAHHLYGVGLEHISVLVHPESIIHSLVEFSDNSLMAHLGAPDMRTAIAGCLAWPEYIDAGVSRIDLARLARLTFEEPDTGAFPCLELARQALQAGNAAPVVLNAANEVAVELFLTGKLRFTGIPRLIEETLARCPASESDFSAPPTHRPDCGAATLPASGAAPATPGHPAELDPVDKKGVSTTLERIAALDAAARATARELAVKIQ